MTPRPSLYAMPDLLQRLFDRVGLAWTRTFRLLADGRSADLVSFDLFIIGLCVLVALWAIGIEWQSRRMRR
jgi:hypothetical protein